MLLSHDRLEKIKWVKPSAVDEEPPKIRIYLFFFADRDANWYTVFR